MLYVQPKAKRALPGPIRVLLLRRALLVLVKNSTFLRNCGGHTSSGDSSKSTNSREGVDSLFGRKLINNRHTAPVVDTYRVVCE
ncbi:hypothetical protein RHA1_ro03502 [Rhodococcus jostii RHA1]|uniref:Uncharacterized protein n=1 Tax=Rhodococcus jostii (strain RHA1) TaxID=101510 RepID=Q0SAY1_RHOJR|nr:hypothetical protein RHA1_ro03502 [Rhodococcus jostii RHA1]